MLDLADDQRIVAGDNIVTRDGDVGLRSPGLLILERITYEKPVKSFPPTIELIDLVAALQLLNPEPGH